MEWVRKYDEGGSVGEQSLDWDEGWNVFDYTPAAGTPAWTGLLADRTDLAPGQIHPIVLSAYATKFDVKPLNTRSTAWVVTISYRNGDPQELDVPPHLRAARIEVQHQAEEVPTMLWADGSPAVNTAGDLLEGLTKTENHWVFSVEKNVLAVPAWTLAYSDAVNSDLVTIRGLNVSPHYLLLQSLRVGNLEAEQVNDVDYLTYPISFTLTYSPRTWMSRVLNRGLYQLIEDGTGGLRKVPCTDSNGDPATEPQFLDAAGRQLNLAFVDGTDGIRTVDPTDIIILDKWNHELLPFSALPLS